MRIKERMGKITFPNVIIPADENKIGVAKELWKKKMEDLYPSSVHYSCALLRYVYVLQGMTRTHFYHMLPLETVFPQA